MTGVSAALIHAIDRTRCVIIAGVKSAKLKGPRWQVFPLAAMLLAAMILIRFAVEDPDEPVFLLGILPIALVALEWGRWFGIAAAAAVSIVITIWLRETQMDLSTFGIAIRYATFFIVGGGLGHYATKLRRQNELLADITDSSPDVIFVKDSNGRYKFMNESGVKALGRESEREILGKRDPDLLPPKLAKSIVAIEDEARSSARPIIRELRSDSVEGEERVFMATIGMLIEQSGSLFVIARDVTERRRAEIEMRRAAQHFELAGDMMCTLSFDGWFLDLNDRWREVLGWSRDEMMRMSVSDLLHPDDRDSMSERWEELSSERMEQYQSRFRGRSGDYRWLSWTSSADPKSGVIYAVVRDITDYKNAEQLKDEFFALVSHELRTPLTSIIGYLELAEESELDEETEEFLKVIKRNTKRLARLVGDLLYVARLESGKEMIVDHREMDLAKTVRLSADAALPVANSNGVSLETTIEVDPAEINGDKERIGQAIDNLISNALKFTPKGGSVRVDLRDLGDEWGVSVTDTGPGISEADQRHLFERFYRTDSVIRAGIPGVGLGLPIVRAIISQHDGRVEVRSEPGAGAAFSLIIPKEMSDNDQ